MGGGSHEAEIWKPFIALAGGSNASIVYIPTADEDNGIAHDTTVEQLKKLGVVHITTLHTRDPKEANRDAFAAPITTATGVWLGGGRQWRLADAYLNTRVLTALNALLERGGVIAGSSAGASIQGSLLIRGDTKGNEIMEGDHKVGFGFLKDSAIDQHILARNRQFDLIPVIEAHPEVLGIGIDEDTAIVVTGNGFEVIGAGYVAITDHRQWDAKDALSPNGAARKGKIYFLRHGERFDLTTRRPIGRSRP